MSATAQMRAATQADLGLVHEIYMDETVNPFMFHDPMSEGEFTAIFNQMTQRDYFWILQTPEGEDCGMASAIRLKGRGSHVAEIQSLGIKREFQGKGLGKSLMQNIIDKLKRDKIERVQLCVEADNDRGIKFYEALGFKEEGRMKKFIKRGPGHYVDEVMMGMTEFNEPPID